MKKILTLLVFLLICACLNAQTMHTLIFVNTQENTEWGGDRTKDRTEDFVNMKDFFTQIANKIGYTNDMRAHKLQQDFTSTMVDQEINRLNVGKNDIVVFYYSGHGANFGNDVWPTLDLIDKGYWQTDILRKLKEKCMNGNSFKPKLLLCIADCCNNVFDGRNVGSFSPELNAAAIKKLFTGFAGRYTITMSASIKGQYSLSDLEDGTLFGIALREAVSECSTSNATWENVLESAKTRTKKMAKPYIQEPQYSIKISGDPFDD